jgi:predicted extracellular nuclease
VTQINARSRSASPWRRVFVVSLAFVLTAPLVANAQVIASDMDGSASQNLVSYTNPWEFAFGSPGDGFQKYQRGVSPTIPFSVLDDSLSIFTADSLGIIKEGNTDEFFGVTDTVNGDTSGPVTATWVFDITGGTDLVLSIDMGAMGDFESSDVFEWSYSIDGGPSMVAFASSVDEAGSQTYTLEGGASFTLNDPMLVDGTVLTNDLATFSTALAGSGSQLTLTLTASTDGGSEAFAFQTIRITAGGLGTQRVAYDMVESDSLRLTSYTNLFEGAFSSAGDGFQKYQRFVSSSIPFSVLDDSLSIFPPDSLGIIKEGNTDVFFGVVDTENSDNSGPVTATWVFDISGASDLGLSIDMGAMGDFESSDYFVWRYSIDGAPATVAFSSSVDEDGSYTYTLEGGASFTLSDPMLVDGTVLTNDLATFSSPIAGTGTSLELTLEAVFNGGSEAVVFQNVIVGSGFDGPQPPPQLEIWEIQGDSTASPYDGEIVEALDNTVTALAPNGFFMQTPTMRTDNDINTSDGIFVFTGSAPSVAVGDQVDVLGTVDEFFGFTELTDNPVVSVDSAANPLPPAVMLNDMVPSPEPTMPSCAIEFECYEGMLVQVVNGVVGGPNQRFGSDPIAEVYIAAGDDRPFREPGVEFPGLPDPAIAVWDGNPEVFELDPDKLGLPNQIIPAGSTFSATGVIGFEFGGYELWPSTLTVEQAVLPRPVRERERAELTIGSLNMFRLFDDVDDPEDNTTGRTRDDAVVSTEEYERRKAKFVAYVLDVLNAPDVLAVQEVEKLGVLEDLAADIAAANSDIVYSAYLEEGNDVGTIDIGFLVRDTVAVDAITQIGKDEILDFDGSLLHDRPPLLLEGRSINEGADYPFAVLNLHNRSLGGIDSPSDGDRVRAKRLAQAQSVAATVQALQESNPAIRLVVAGDFNAFEFSDGYVDVLGQIRGDVDPSANLLSGPDLVEPDLINQVLSIEPDERYSFIFGGSAQVLDHALTSMALDASFRGLMYGRGNADAALDLINDDSAAVLPLRSSDHDGLVLFLTKDVDGDGVNDDADVCPMTMIPEMPAVGLGKNRFALTDDDFEFDTNAPNGKGPGRSYSTEDTAGCSCAQIIEAEGLGKGHEKFGCSIGVMDNWVRSVR